MATHPLVANKDNPKLTFRLLCTQQLVVNVLPYYIKKTPLGVPLIALQFELLPTIMRPFGQIGWLQRHHQTTNQLSNLT